MSDTKLDELERQLAELTERVRAERERAKVDLLATIADMLKKGSLTPDDLRALFPADAPKYPPKFRDPVTGATWSGKGKTPVWMEGKDREQFRIGGAKQ